MPGTTRYSATFDRTYEEDDRNSPAPSNGMRRSRSQSWQAHLGLNGRPYSPFENNRLNQRSSSTDGGSAKSTETIPTRTLSKPVVKTHNNPFQFVAVGSSPLYKKAEEQLKKVKEVKKVDVLKEEEEEWQSNLDSWKSRRRKMSEDVFRRQEEIRQFELEQQQQTEQANQKKIKTFSEIVEARAHRGRTLSLCLISSPLELQNLESESDNCKNNGTQSYSEGSEENSAVNSEDEGIGKGVTRRNFLNKKAQSTENILSTSSTPKNKFFELGENGHSPNNGSCFDSGLESISSSHKLGDTPDSCSDFSQDSGSCADCDSPRVSGLVLNEANLLEKFNANDLLRTNNPICVTEGRAAANSINNGNDEQSDFSSDFHSEKSEILSSVSDGSDITLCLTSDANNNSKSDKMVNQALFRQSKDNYGEISSETTKPSVEFFNSAELQQKQEKSVESENEVFVDDFEELNNNKTVLLPNSCHPKDLNSADKNENKITKTNNSSNLISNFNQNSEDLNVVFQSKTVESANLGHTNASKSESSIKEQIVLKDVPPVEQVAEEMERFILQQLEEQEREKELSSNVICDDVFESPEHTPLFRSRSTEPPKEKPPPPPCDENETIKSASLKRVNSTKRIKKEICKRRSNFLGIENDINATSDELTIPPPPALEQILRAERELDRESRKRVEDATTERLILEENEIRKKEQEIIETIETEERQKQLLNNCDGFIGVKSNCTNVCDISEAVDRIELLKEEKKKLEKEKILAEETTLRLLEEKQLREREELIRKQEANNSTSAEFSAPFHSDTANLSNAENIAFISAKTKPNISESGVNGDGENKISSQICALSDQTKSEISGKPNIPNKPSVPPKPLKKKEAIRKERERLRQEQEALVREREEHRRKLKEEEEQLKSHQNSHAHDAPVSRLAPLPSLIKPAYTPQLTIPKSAQPRENVAITSRIHSAAQNGITGEKSVEPAPRTVSKRNKPIPPPKKTVKSELRNQQKVPSVKKQDLIAESKYNQNHWLIQEAEMRRINELKERQRVSYFSNSQTHLAEDAVCSVSPKAPVLSNGLHLNDPVQEKIWNHGPHNMGMLKYPPPNSSDQPLVTYPPSKPSRVVPLERPEQMLSVSGRKRCSHCNDELGRGAAMIIESLQLYYHIQCFQCCVCQAQLGNGSCGTDVRVRNNKLHCQNCYSNDEAGLKFSQV